jgi:hypothetical protein
MKVLSPRAHGVLDYGTIALFALAPSIFHFSGPYATACYILAGGYLLITLLTDFPMGVARVIPFPMHGGLELVSGLALLAVPFILGFHDDNPEARNFFMGMGILFLGSWLLTDWRADTHANSSSNRMMPNHQH